MMEKQNKPAHPLIKHTQRYCAEHPNLGGSRLLSQHTRHRAIAFFEQQIYIQLGLVTPKNTGQHNLRSLWTTSVSLDRARAEEAKQRAQAAARNHMSGAHFSDTYTGDTLAIYRESVTHIGKVMRGLLGNTHSASKWLTWRTEAMTVADIKGNKKTIIP